MLSGLIEQKAPIPSVEESDAALPVRWQLNRGGIVNVYQYIDDVIDFGGGRLLLRGANGAGKTTAMNMLLPFLLDTRLRGLDAAGEQTGTQILKSWMLDGYDDPQRGGYLWVEFRRRDEFFVCGCGLKASRSVQNVNQWWFVTSQRPGSDFSLVEDRVPLSERQLGDLLGVGHVFNKSRRRDYRREVEKRLFGGVSIDQHIRLVNRVRNPRICDRIDEDIPQLLKESLPQLSDRILGEVGGALDELEEHYREVVELERTSKELEGILAVYRSYCFSWIRKTTDRGYEHLETIRRVERKRERHRRVADAAKRKVKQLERRIGHLERDTEQLSLNISDLRSLPAYRSVRELDSKRDLVEAHREIVTEKQARVSAAESRFQDDIGRLEERESDVRQHLGRINHRFSKVSEAARLHRIGGTPPGPMHFLEPDAVTSVIARVGGEIGLFEASLRQKRDHVGEVEDLIEEVRVLEDMQRRADDMWKVAHDRSVDARRDLQERTQELTGAIQDWCGQSQGWASRVVALTTDAPRGLTDVAGGQLSVSTRTETETKRELLAADAAELIAKQRRLLAEAEQELSDTQRAERKTRTVSDRWSSLTEPDLPYLPWQAPGDYCLADLIDFLPSLSDTDRAGLEAALEASGLLSARLKDRSVVLADGELVAISSTPAAEPLSRILTVRIPARLQRRTDITAVAALLESLSTDPSDTEASAVVSTDGTFRVGALRGRHSKDHAEFIGEAARQATLDRGRREAKCCLERAITETLRTRNLKDRYENTVRRLDDIRKELPALTGVVEADARLAESQEAAEREEERLSERAEQREAAEHALDAAKDRLSVIAKERSLPHEKNALAQVRSGLRSAEHHLGECRRLLEDLEGSTGRRDDASRRRGNSERALAEVRAALTHQQEELRSQEESLRVLESSIGEEEKMISEQLRQHQEDLEAKRADLRDARSEKDKAVEGRAQADADAESSDSEWDLLNTTSDTLTQGTLEALATPGFWAALTDIPYPSDQLTLPGDLRRLLATVAEYLPAYSGETVGVGSVYQSERQRRDRLGGGWDTEIRSPDIEELPLLIEVTGPAGRQSLADATAAVRLKHERDSKILAEGQERELRDLLQGEIAKEVAEKSRAAKDLIAAMREHLRKLSTASRIGVDIRWRPAPALNSDTTRMVELLSMLPDIRTDGEQKTLIRLLGGHLERSREDNPEMGYRQALSEALDYKKWHQLQVVVKRGRQTKLLSRRNDLSEGEKKFVTYLPLFAAVAASCDSIADASEDPGTARFVLLDDAFAKVSEDNHAQLFGLLTDLDLDWIATSERLWGDHATIPDLEIVEVIRDPELRAILLDRYRWNGRTLSATDTHG